MSTTMSNMIDEHIKRNSQLDYVTKEAIQQYISTLPDDYKDGFDKNAIRPFKVFQREGFTELDTFNNVMAQLSEYRINVLKFIPLSDDNKDELQEAKEVAVLMFENCLLKTDHIIHLSTLSSKQDRSELYQNAFMYFALVQRIKQAGMKIPKELTLE
mgnify:CR=1 FL=1